MNRFMRTFCALCQVIAILLFYAPTAFSQEVLSIPNPGFENIGPGRMVPEGWQPGLGGNADAEIAADETVHHTGQRSVRITNRSPLKAFVYALLSSLPVTVRPRTTYIAHFWVRGLAARGCYVAVSFDGKGEQRKYLPTGDFDWRQISCSFTTPDTCSRVRLQIASDDITQALWIDDVSLEKSALQLVDLPECRTVEARTGVFPRSPEKVADRLVVFDTNGRPDGTAMAVSALQGIVNRRKPRLYVINPTNPSGQDWVWLRYLHEKRYTGAEQTVQSLADLISMFRNEIRGVIIIDPDLPGSINAAYMLAGIENALPVTPEMAPTLGLPVITDLRGRWKRNVEAYRWMYEHYWDRMSHRILAWEHPLSTFRGARDYMVEFNIFTFWVSSYGDKGKGDDPDAEEAFVNELLANTPANIPVMGWPMFGDSKGITEYAAVHWLSEYGKFVPGTQFCTNLSVHTAIHPDPRRLQASIPSPPSTVRLDRSKIYLSVNILDSGDALWYWMLWQRKLWADPARGSVPIGWCMNPTLSETLPAVLQWYCENASPKDTFFAAVSGLGYMNTQTYASRFRAEDRERIWREYVQLTATEMRRAGMHGIELYNGGWSEPTPPAPGTFQRFVQGIAGLDYILADLGRHDSIHPGDAASLVNGVPVFHTLTRYEVWSTSAEVTQHTMQASNAWLSKEIKAHAPPSRPGFLSAMAISWYYAPSWIVDLKNQLPPEYVLVSPGELARLFRETERLNRHSPAATKKGNTSAISQERTSPRP